MRHLSRNIEFGEPLLTHFYKFTHPHSWTGMLWCQQEGSIAYGDIFQYIKEYAIVHKRLPKNEQRTKKRFIIWHLFDIIHNLVPSPWFPFTMHGLNSIFTIMFTIMFTNTTHNKSIRDTINVIILHGKQICDYYYLFCNCSNSSSIYIAYNWLNRIS